MTQKYSSLTSVRATRERLSELGLTTKKYLGQHFLIDDGVLGKILRLANLQADSCVLEVGPGIGTLTEALLTQQATLAQQALPAQKVELDVVGSDESFRAQQVKLIAVELDDSLLAGLAERFPELHLIGGDALDPVTIAKLQVLAPRALVANLPYAVAATILLEYFQVLPSLEQATVMVQREVAERITAQPGSKEYGAYTVKLRLLAQVIDQFKVSPQSFYPPPRVDSAVVRLERTHFFDETFGAPSGDHFGNPSVATSGDPKSEHLSMSSSKPFATASMLADAGFFQRRKTIRNSIHAYFTEHDLDKDIVDDILDAAIIDPSRRGETLSPGDYLSLALACVKKPSKPTSSCASRSDVATFGSAKRDSTSVAGSSRSFKQVLQHPATPDAQDDGFLHSLPSL